MSKDKPLIYGTLYSLVGYELALVAAPRSMQATAMGIFFSIDGLANLVKLVVIYTPGGFFTDTFYFVGIGTNVLGLIFVVTINKKWRLLGE